MNNNVIRVKPSKASRFFCTILAVLIAIALIAPINIQSAYAEPTSAQKQAEADEVAAKLSALEEEMIQIGEDYRQSVEAHDAATAAMGKAQERIDAAQLVIANTQDKLGARANSMYRNGPLSFLDVLFGASSFEQFTTSWDILNNINKENANLIQANKDAREDAKQAYDEFSTQEKIAAEHLAESKAIKAKAEDNIAAQSAELAGLEAEVAELVAAEQEAKRIRDEEIARRQAPAVIKTYPDFEPVPVPSDGYGDVVSAAVSRLGCPYVWAGKGPDVFDCSGLTSWCYSQAGRGYIGASDGSQYAAAGSKWSYSGPDSAAPGDVLWWPGHVAIYVGGGSYIHAPTPGQVVSYSSWNIDNAVVLRF